MINKLDLTSKSKAVEDLHDTQSTVAGIEPALIGAPGSVVKLGPHIVAKHESIPDSPTKASLRGLIGSIRR